MAGAVHGLHSESLVLDLEDEDVVLVVEVVTGRLPQLEVENVGGHNFLVASHSVLLLDHADEVVVNPSTFWIHETASGRELVHVEQILLSTDGSVVSPRCFLLNVHPLVQFLLAGESDSVHSLETIVVGFTEPVSARVLGDLERFDNLG